jgi:hypothetical protein
MGEQLRAPQLRAKYMPNQKVFFFGSESSEVSKSSMASSFKVLVNDFPDSCIFTESKRSSDRLLSNSVEFLVIKWGIYLLVAKLNLERLG